MQIVPLRAAGNQALQIVLGGQNCSLRVYTRTTADSGDKLYLDLSVNQGIVFQGQLCLQYLPLPLYNYLGFRGKLLFVDLQGSEPPRWNGLGKRWQLVFLAPEEFREFWQEETPGGEA